jgi:hypothetical protein
MKKSFVSALALAVLMTGGSAAVFGQSVSREVLVQLANCIPGDPDYSLEIKRVPRAAVERDGRGELVYRINANETWRRTDLEVKRGQRIEISASGTIRWAQDGAAWTFVTADGTVRPHAKQFPYPDAGIGSLIMRIGKTVYPAGSSVVIEVEDDGFVEFMISYDVLGDNSGAFLVRINAQPIF